MTPIERQLAPAGGWIVPGRRRIDPLSPADMRWWERVLVWILLRLKRPASANARLPEVLAVLMRNRRLFRAWLRFAARLMPGGSLDRVDTELVILRVAWNCRCRYEWGQHVAIGLRAGLSAEEVARIARGPDVPGWTPHQAALLQATDELHRDRLISEDTWRRLAGRHGPEQMIEITLLVGQYEMLAGFLNSAGLSLEPQVEDALAKADIHGDSGPE